MEELSALLNKLEDIGISNGELYDTDVKEQMNDAILEIFINENFEYKVPESFGMFSESSDKEVHDAFKIFQSCINTRNLDYLTKLSLLGPNGIVSKNGQISECFFGEISYNSLSQTSYEAPFSWLQNDWVYYLFISIPGIILFALVVIYKPSYLKGFWYILVFIVAMVISLIIGDKLWQFCANNTFRKHDNT